MNSLRQYTHVYADPALKLKRYVQRSEKTYCSILIKFEGLGKKSHHYVPFRTRTKRVKKKIKKLEKVVLIYK